ncbi:MAG: hypothetical protein PVJ39_22110, partial [Gammaproteobacteria bacterium]
MQTCYTYDAYGHKRLTQSTGFDGQYDDDGNAQAANSTTTRATTVEYFVNGTSPNSATYQIKTTNDLGHSQIDTID